MKIVLIHMQMCMSTMPNILYRVMPSRLLKFQHSPFPLQLKMSMILSRSGGMVPDCQMVAGIVCSLWAMGSLAYFSSSAEMPQMHTSTWRSSIFWAAMRFFNYVIQHWYHDTTQLHDNSLWLNLIQLLKILSPMPWQPSVIWEDPTICYTNCSHLWWGFAFSFLLGWKAR